MTIHCSGKAPVPAELAKVDPKNVNHGLLLEVVELMAPLLEGAVPRKRSGYQGDAYLFVELYCGLTRLAYGKTTTYLNAVLKAAGVSFQKSGADVFANGKTRRAVPDQPAMSRFLAALEGAGKAEAFGNLVFLGMLAYMQKQGLAGGELTLIADYHLEDCQKDKGDPYCFGTREGKTKHKTLAFSVLSKGLHQVVATFAIYKRQPKLPLFEQVVKSLAALGFAIKYALLDREFYRKGLLMALRGWGITTILPGRRCAQTRRKVHLWLHGKGGRRTRYKMVLGSAKNWGQKELVMDMVLHAKRGHALAETKREFKAGKLSLGEAERQVFPLLVSRGNARGIRAVKDNEHYIRYLYRLRWAIEIMFREARRFGTADWVQGRGKRLFRFNCKCVAYNLWQAERMKLQLRNPGAAELTLDEFCGRLLENRSRQGLLASLGGAAAKC